MSNLLLVLATALLTSHSWAHNCTDFMNYGYQPDAAWACYPVEQSNVEELCLSSIPYPGEKRFGQAEAKWIHEDGNLYKFFMSHAFMGEDEPRRFLHNENLYQLHTLIEGSPTFQENDYRTRIKIDLNTNRGHFVTHKRPSTYVIPKRWAVHLKAELECERIR
ncbi:MAG TPA: hypothetical protein VKZ84_02525 [Bacteriovoracaceae bacterium]|nr:hypothetical protein [Bacteriovoracaceae bacterium]